MIFCCKRTNTQMIFPGTQLLPNQKRNVCFILQMENGLPCVNKTDEYKYWHKDR